MGVSWGLVLCSGYVGGICCWSVVLQGEFGLLIVGLGEGENNQWFKFFCGHCVAV